MGSQEDREAREFERKIGAYREYTYDPKTGQPVSYTLKYGWGCLLSFLAIPLLLATILKSD